MRKSDLPNSGNDPVITPPLAPQTEITLPDTAPAQPPGWVLSLRAKLDPYFTPARREAVARVLAATIFGLQGLGVLTADKAALWSQLGVAAIGLLYALLWAGTAVRAALYSVLLVGASLMMAYGIAQNVDWAIILASVGQAFGITTAAAKAQPPTSS